MKLVKNLEMRQEKTSKYTTRYGLFLCPYCDEEVEKRKSDGVKCNSCGCMRYKLPNKRYTTHGDAQRSKVTKLYHVWHRMKDRCDNPNQDHYKYYGGRGIKVCEQWKKHYIMFKIWALLHGYKDNLTIDRIDNDGNYEPSNCRFVTQAVNNKNKRNVKLNWLTVRLIRALRDDGYAPKELFKIFDIKPATLNNVIYDQNWKE